VNHCVFVPAGQRGDYWCLLCRLTKQQRQFETAQLWRRTWNITDHTQATHNVSGDGVVGMYPFLTEDGYSEPYSGQTGKTFSYTSQLGPAPYDIDLDTGKTGAKFGGEFLFVPGSLQVCILHRCCERCTRKLALRIWLHRCLPQSPTGRPFPVTVPVIDLVVEPTFL